MPDSKPGHAVFYILPLPPYLSSFYGEQRRTTFDPTHKVALGEVSNNIDKYIQGFILKLAKLFEIKISWFE